MGVRHFYQTYQNYAQKIAPHYLSCQVATYIEHYDTRFALTQPCNWNHRAIVSPCTLDKDNPNFSRCLMLY